MRRRTPLLLPALWALGTIAAAQTATIAPVPQTHVPPTVLLELRAVETQFDTALSRDCAPERCFSKGCVYRDHVAVDMPRNGSLPGLGLGEGPGSTPPQEYLTAARCEFTHEKSVSSRDVQALKRRLEQRLSKGWLQVTVTHQPLEPVSAGLRESPPQKPEEVPAPAPAPVAPPPPAPVEWDTTVAIRELWVSLLPHFSWMIAVVLLTLAALTVIWALRRLGRESLEEKAMAAQLAAEATRPAAASEPAAPPPAEAAAAQPGALEEESAFVKAQQQQWTDKIAQAELTREDSAVVELLRHWLRNGEYALLAKAILRFGDRLSLAFSAEGELAGKKLELAEYLATLDESKLPSDAEFFKKLNQHAASSSVLAQADAELYRSLREEFGAHGVARLVEALPGRFGALLFGLVPSDVQQDAARLMSAPERLNLAGQLMLSNRISPQEQSHLFEVVEAARAGQPLPRAPQEDGIPDRGRVFDAAGALSVLLGFVDATERAALFGRMLQQSAGALPRWFEDILHPDMLLKLPQELAADVLLDVDVKGLAGWSSVQSPQWQESFLSRLAPAMQNAVKASMSFQSRADQLRLAKAGHDELVSAVKKQVARGKLSFPELVA